jgi:hypothetical protein
MAGLTHRATRGRGRSADTVQVVAAPADPERPVTGSTYRLLLTRGFGPDEAANLTAFLCGIPVADVRWSLHQVNRLLFLQALARTGRFGPADGGSPRPH